MPNAITHSPEETRHLGSNFARTLAGGETIGLRGPLGAGKTEFVRGILKYFGVKEPVTSPTFVLSKPYNVHGGVIRTIIHVDAYRLKKPEELMATEVMDAWGRPENIVLLEWPERVSAVTPKNIEYITIDRGRENLRFWTFSKVRNRLLQHREK